MAEATKISARARQDAIAARIAQDIALIFAMLAFGNVGRLLDGAIALQARERRAPKLENPCNLTICRTDEPIAHGKVFNVIAARRSPRR